MELVCLVSTSNDWWRKWSAGVWCPLLLQQVIWFLGAFLRSVTLVRAEWELHYSKSQEDTSCGYFSWFVFFFIYLFFIFFLFNLCLWFDSEANGKLPQITFLWPYVPQEHKELVLFRVCHIPRRSPSHVFTSGFYSTSQTQPMPFSAQHDGRLAPHGGWNEMWSGHDADPLRNCGQDNSLQFLSTRTHFSISGTSTRLITSSETFLNNAE